MVVALIALFVALGGTGIAARHYLITSTSQIKPSVLKQLQRAGERGPAGLPGREGPPGSVGPRGEAVVGERGPPGEASTLTARFLLEAEKPRQTFLYTPTVELQTGACVPGGPSSEATALIINPHGDEIIDESGSRFRGKELATPKAAHARTLYLIWDGTAVHELRIQTIAGSPEVVGCQYEAVYR
jgi:hypothetical protein